MFTVQRPEYLACQIQKIMPNTTRRRLEISRYCEKPAFKSDERKGTRTYELTPRPAGDVEFAMREAFSGLMALGSTDEQKPAADDTVEAWARSAANPVGGWYDLKKVLRGRFANYVPPVLEALGPAEVEHNPKSNRMRAK